VSVLCCVASLAIDLPESHRCWVRGRQKTGSGLDWCGQGKPIPAKPGRAHHLQLLKSRNGMAREAHTSRYPTICHLSHVFFPSPVSALWFGHWMPAQQCYLTPQVETAEPPIHSITKRCLRACYPAVHLSDELHSPSPPYTPTAYPCCKHSGKTVKRARLLRTATGRPGGKGDGKAIGARAYASSS
jgi:hypothetical protein